MGLFDKLPAPKRPADLEAEESPPSKIKRLSGVPGEDSLAAAAGCAPSLPVIGQKRSWVTLGARGSCNGRISLLDSPARRPPVQRRQRPPWPSPAPRI